MATRRLLISGRVQGVFYRGWMEATASELGLSGWVRNIRSGEVEALVSGSGDQIEELIRRCWQGPTAAEVTNVVAEESVENVGEGFSIRPTL